MQTSLRIHKSSTERLCVRCFSQLSKSKELYIGQEILFTPLIFANQLGSASLCIYSDHQKKGLGSQMIHFYLGKGDEAGCQHSW